MTYHLATLGGEPFEADLSTFDDGGTATVLSARTERGQEWLAANAAGYPHREASAVIVGHLAVDNMIDAAIRAGLIVDGDKV